MTAAPESAERPPAASAIRDHLADEVRFAMRGTTLRDRWRIARLLAHNHLRVGRLRSVTSRIPRRPSKEFDLDLRDGPNLRLRNDDVVLAYIYGIGEYDVDFGPLGRVTSLLDLGANVGLASLYLDERLSLERVAAVEASGPNVRLLAENFRRNLPSASILHAAVVGEQGDYHVEEGRFPGEIRVLPGIGTVEAMTLPEVLDHFEMQSVDLMKIDIEGGEATIFENASAWANRVGSILGEVHPPLTTAAALGQLAPFGFRPLPLPDRSYFQDILFLHKPR